MWHINQRVITTHGVVRVIAFLHPDGTVYAFCPRGGLERIVPVTDAWGGEADMEVGLAA